MRIHCDFLTTSSPAERKIRSIGGNCSRWRMRASCLITLASVSIARSVWQISQVVSMKLLHVMRRNLIQVHPIWTNLCKSNKNQNMGSLQKSVFLEKLVFSTGPTIFWVFEAPGICIDLCIHILIYIHVLMTFQLAGFRVATVCQGDRPVSHAWANHGRVCLLFGSCQWLDYMVSGWPDPIPFRWSIFRQRRPHRHQSSWASGVEVMGSAASNHSSSLSPGSVGTSSKVLKTAAWPSSSVSYHSRFQPLGNSQWFCCLMI